MVLWNEEFDTARNHKSEKAALVCSAKWVFHLVGVSCSTVCTQQDPLGQIYVPTTFHIKPTPLTSWLHAAHLM